MYIHVYHGRQHINVSAYSLYFYRVGLNNMAMTRITLGILLMYLIWRNRSALGIAGEQIGSDYKHLQRIFSTEFDRNTGTYAQKKKITMGV